MTVFSSHDINGTLWNDSVLNLVGLLVPVGPDHSLLSGLGRSGRWRELPPSPMADVWTGCLDYLLFLLN